MLWRYSTNHWPYVLTSRSYRHRGISESKDASVMFPASQPHYWDRSLRNNPFDRWRLFLARQEIYYRTKFLQNHLPIRPLHNPEQKGLGICSRMRHKMV